MSGRVVLLLAVLAGLAGPGGLAVAPPAAAQDGRGPGELWEAFPVDGQPAPGSAAPGPGAGAGAAAGAGAPDAAALPLRAAPAGAWRDQPRATGTLALITAGCVGLGVALAVAGLLIAGGRLRTPRAAGRRAVARRAP